MYSSVYVVATFRLQNNIFAYFFTELKNELKAEFSKSVI